MCHLFGELGLNLAAPLCVLCHNMGAIRLSVHPAHHSRTKHMFIGFHFVPNLFHKGFLFVSYVNIVDQFSNVLTRPLARACFLLLCPKIVVVDGSPIF